MALQMARPFRHPRSGVYYFRQRVPADLCPILGNKIVSRSLRTKDPEEAKLRHAEEARKQSLIWAAHRATPEPLPHQQIVALSGLVYREWMAMRETEPGEPGIWEETLALLDRAEAAADGLERWYGSSVDKLLLEQGIATDAHSRQRLIQEIHRAFRQVAQQQHKRAEGDYSPDPKADRFPPFKAPATAPEGAPDKISLGDLFKLWERDHVAAGRAAKTVTDFRQKVDALASFLGHDDARKVTPENVADWCDYLKHDKGLAARTVSQKYLAAVKVIFALAVEKRKLPESPVEGVKVRFSKPQRVRSAGFTDAEAKAILRASLVAPEMLGRRTEETKRAIRWAPWICAFTGARITEVTQLRTQDLIEVGGVTCLRITPDAGSVKTGRFRIVPVHPQLMEMGLVDLFHSLPPGPVFYSTETKRKAADPLSRARATGGKVGAWVRDVVKITDSRIQPNHAWRHRFKTIARECGIDQEIRDAIQGHEDGRAARDYGEVSVPAMWSAIQKLPRIHAHGTVPPHEEDGGRNRGAGLGRPAAPL